MILPPFTGLDKEYMQYSFRYMEIISALTKVVKEQQNEINELKEKLADFLN
jgi:hypothetical protein